MCSVREATCIALGSGGLPLIFIQEFCRQGTSVNYLLIVYALTSLLQCVQVGCTRACRLPSLFHLEFLRFFFVSAVFWTEEESVGPLLCLSRTSEISDFSFSVIISGCDFSALECESCIKAKQVR